MKKKNESGAKAVKKNLKDFRVLLTRSDNAELAVALRELGASVLEMPLIKISADKISSDTSDAVKGIGSYNWLLFSSRNGVKAFFKAFFQEYQDIRCLGMANIACVGDGTAEELSKYFLKADCVPQKQTAMGMIEALVEFESLENLRILNVRGNKSSTEIEEILDKKYRAIVDGICVYSTEILELRKDDETLEDFRKNGADVVLFASGSAVEGFVKNIKKLKTSANAKMPKILAIGQPTNAVLEKFSLKAAAVSPSPSTESLVLEILKLAK